MVRKQELILIGLRVLMFVLFVPFVIGWILNYDGMDIIRHAEAYQSGILNVDSLSYTPGKRRKPPTVRAYGNVSNVHTGIILGNRDSESTERLIHAHAQRPLRIPVWYRADGESTLEQHPDENAFPKGRIINKLILNVLLFNMPFIVVWIIAWMYKRKHKNDVQANS